MHPAYNHRVIKSEDMAVTESIVQKVISLPIYPELSKNDLNKIVNRIKRFFKL
jgi:dTDP-4-amino-4,6-dideoxygalactose transaminase